MASQVPPAHSSPGSPSSWPRGWVDFDDYQVIHARYIDALARDGYVDSDSLRFTIYEGERGRIDQISLEGTIHCADGVVVEVTKYMDVRQRGDRLEVLTNYYRYHAWRPGHRAPALIRYDQAHGVPHYHRFDDAGETERYDQLTLDTMPRLDAVVREAVDLARERDLGIT